MRRVATAVFLTVVCLVLGACGGARNVVTCAERHEMGACIPGHKNLTAAPLTARGPLCIDVSQWQGWHPNLAGVRCVIIQSNYGLNIEPSVISQIADARAHGIPYGCYTYLEPGVAGEAQAILANRVCQGRSLGLWADAELTGTYQHACPYVARALTLGHIAGLYTSPGLWPGGRCAGYLWPAEWGGSVYPFAGYLWAAVKFRQWCGTCFLHGVETDLNEDLGLIALSHPPKPVPPPSPSVLERRILALRADLARHQCRVAPYHGRGRYHRICKVWKAEGDQAHRELRA